MYFGNRRPRGFHHTFRFSNERRDILDALKRGVAPEDVARQSLKACPTATVSRQDSRHASPDGSSSWRCCYCWQP